MQIVNDAGRFQDKKVHLFKWTSGDRAGTYCGLNERDAIWQEPDEGITCGFCLRKLAEATNERLRVALEAR